MYVIKVKQSESLTYNLCKVLRTRFLSATAQKLGFRGWKPKPKNGFPVVETDFRNTEQIHNKNMIIVRQPKNWFPVVETDFTKTEQIHNKKRSSFGNQKNKVPVVETERKKLVSGVWNRNKTFDLRWWKPILQTRNKNIIIMDFRWGKRI